MSTGLLGICKRNLKKSRLELNRCCPVDVEEVTREVDVAIPTRHGTSSSSRPLNELIIAGESEGAYL